MRNITSIARILHEILVFQRRKEGEKKTRRQNIRVREPITADKL